MEYGQMTKSYQEPDVKETSVLQTLISQFEKANAEQSGNCDRLRDLHSRLNQEPPVPQGLSENKIQKGGLTSGEGLLATIEGMIIKYQDTINIQHAVISRLEKLI